MVRDIDVWSSPINFLSKKFQKILGGGSRFIGATFEFGGGEKIFVKTRFLAFSGDWRLFGTNLYFSTKTDRRQNFKNSKKFSKLLKFFALIRISYV
jgi:hypothetical protein